MFNKRVVAICGRAQSGKSTAAKLLMGANREILSFADPIKQMLLAMGSQIGLEYRHVYGSDADKNEVLECLGYNTARRAMQTLGTEWREMLHRDLWVRHLDMRIDHSKANVVIVDDMRFEHEYNHLKTGGALIIGIERPGQGTTSPTHASEVWDFRTTGMPVIQNDGTVEELWEKLSKYA